MINEIKKKLIMTYKKIIKKNQFDNLIQFDLIRFKDI